MNSNEQMSSTTIGVAGGTVALENVLRQKGFGSLKASIDSIEFFRWVNANAQDLSNEILKSLATNLAPFWRTGRARFLQVWEKSGRTKSEGESLFQDAVEAHQNGLRPASFEVLRYQGYDAAQPPDESPAAEIKRLWREADLKERGFYRNDRGRLQLNANAFVRYALTRIDLKMCNHAYYIYDKSGVYKQIPDMNVSKIFRHIMHEALDDIWKKSYEAEYLGALKLQVAQVAQLNSNRSLINLENGMLDIVTGKLRPHDPAYLSTVRVPITFDPNAKCPTFERFIAEVMMDDEQMIKLVQEIMGWLLTTDNRIQKAFFFWGEGANGKSVLAEVIRRLCGIDNVSNVPLSVLGARFGLQNLPGKTVNISTENEFTGKVINTQTFKAITGGDSVEVEQKFKQSYSTTLFCKLVALVNNLPNTHDHSDGFFRRIVLIPFRRTFRDAEADKNLLDKLLLELSGILNFALTGLTQLIAQDYNFTEAATAVEAHRSYHEEQNPVIEFCRDMVRETHGASTKRPDFRTAYIDWCQRNGNDDWSKIATQTFWNLFRQALRQNGIEQRPKKIKGTIYLDGLSIDGWGSKPQNDDQQLEFA